MRNALQGLLELYTGLVSSNDEGNWDPEKEEEVIAARAALAETPSRESSPELSSLAAKYLGMSFDYFRGYAGLDHNTRELEVVLTDIKRLAASVLSQST